MNRTGHVRGADVELRAVVGEERRVTPALFLFEHVDLTLELGVRGNAAGLGQYLTALDLVLVYAAKQTTNVVASLTVVEDLAEHLDAGDDRLAGVIEADDLDLFAGLDLTTLDTARGHRAAALDAEYILDRHQEGLVGQTLGLGHVLVQSVHQILDGGRPLLVALQRRKRSAHDHRSVIASELVLVEQLAHLHLDQLQHFLVFDCVALVEEHHDVVQTYLASQQHVLAGLRHDRIDRAHRQDGAIHLRRAGDHVLDEVGVARTVNVRVVALVALVLHVSHGDGDRLGRIANRTALGDVGVALDLCQPIAGLHHQDGRGERRLAMVDVTNRADVYVWLVTDEFFLGHVLLSLSL